MGPWQFYALESKNLDQQVRTNVLKAGMIVLFLRNFFIVATGKNSLWHTK